jgi:hypothetical protein
MSLVVAVVGFVLIVLAGVLPQRLPHLQPAETTTSIASSVRLGLVLVHLGLLATAAPVLLGAVGGHDVGSVCAELLGPPAPGGDATAWASAAASAWMFGGRWRARRHNRRIGRSVRIERWIGSHDLRDGVDHVTIPLQQPLAYAVPGRRPQIVVSEGLRQVCDEEELAAVLRHEASHLRHHHERPLRVAQQLEQVVGLLPGSRRTAVALRLAVERTADEDAIHEPAHRAHVRNALLKVVAPEIPPALAFLTPDTILHRLQALEDEMTVDPRRRRRSRALVSVPFLVVAAAGTAWFFSAHHLVLGFTSLCW